MNEKLDLTKILKTVQKDGSFIQPYLEKKLIYYM